LHRLFPLYLDRAASPKIVARIERHLLGCGECRARLVRLRDAKSLLENVRPLEAPPFVWSAATPVAALPSPSQSGDWRRRTPNIVRRFAADAAIAASLFLVFTLLYTHAASARSRLFDLSEFRPIALRSVSQNTDPHVIVQGVVSPIKGDFEEENRRFRLADPHDPRAFVVCELLDGDPQSMPKAGTRVRVWGVTRYDSNPDHRWFEIHPVLKVEVVR
jgi:hypothetical protein